MINLDNQCMITTALCYLLALLSQQEDVHFKPQQRQEVFLCRVCMPSLCQRGFTPGTLVSSHSRV